MYKATITSVVTLGLTLGAFASDECCEQAEPSKAEIESKLDRLKDQKEQLSQMMEDIASQKDISAMEKEALNEEFAKTQKELDESISSLRSKSSS
jgi:septal ring factor EnvC (AmiA/AmiB activator)